MFGEASHLRWSIPTQPTLRTEDGTEWSATDGPATADYRLEDFFGGGTTKKSTDVDMPPLCGQVKATSSGVDIGEDWSRRAERPLLGPQRRAPRRRRAGSEQDRCGHGRRSVSDQPPAMR